MDKLLVGEFTTTWSVIQKHIGIQKNIFELLPVCRKIFLWPAFYLLAGF